VGGNENFVGGGIEEGAGAKGGEEAVFCFVLVSQKGHTNKPHNQRRSLPGV